ncbi:hypothetical protein A5707_18425 [Mycobacterium kyorinense]|uniref:Uncharacterized protein n=1 Tax=Mycobacterium kyorinense TaxID=487514 RepID=A0A1A2ZBP4_9MYCO|nr:hypothetical protein [Mycobacterium kyorinense]OBI48089.1 hypothetical protein A5707_18425 [Mycobacterium kyorinense]
MGLAEVKQAALETARKIGEAARAYAGSDQQIADRINQQMHPDKDEDQRRGVQAVDNRTFRDAPQFPGDSDDPSRMTPEQARAAYDRLKGHIRAHNLSPPPPHDTGAVAAYNREAAALNARKAALEARLAELGVPVEGEAPAHPEQAPPPFPPPQHMTGLTEHGAQRINGRDSHGVNDSALGDAVKHPIGPPQYAPDQYGGSYTYVGKDATVILNKDGQVITAWANSRNGWRNP